MCSLEGGGTVSYATGILCPDPEAASREYNCYVATTDIPNLNFGKSRHRPIANHIA